MRRAVFLAALSTAMPARVAAEASAVAEREAEEARIKAEGEELARERAARKEEIKSFIYYVERHL
jgi:hypothetical protein